MIDGEDPETIGPARIVAFESHFFIREWPALVSVCVSRLCVAPGRAHDYLWDGANWQTNIGGDAAREFASRIPQFAIKRRPCFRDGLKESNKKRRSPQARARIVWSL
jgi:hypothetical protein